MSLTGSGNQHRHHNYEKCPKCNKKGYYQPLSEVVNDVIVDFPKMCKYCDYVKGDTDAK